MQIHPNIKLYYVIYRNKYGVKIYAIFGLSKAAALKLRDERQKEDDFSGNSEQNVYDIEEMETLS